MGKQSKRMREITRRVEDKAEYKLEEAVKVLKECPQVKFDQTVDLVIQLGVDPKKSDQQVRATVSLPHGTGKITRVLVFTTGTKVQEALDAGADYVGFEDLAEKIKSGWTDFDAVVATPETMREVGKLGKILGPRNLMPTPKAGTVTPDVAGAVKELKAGRIELKLDRQAVCSAGVAKLSFPEVKIVENIKAVLQTIVRAKPVTAKGVYIQNVVLSSTMGPGLKLDFKEQIG